MLKDALLYEAIARKAVRAAIEDLFAHNLPCVISLNDQVYYMTKDRKLTKTKPKVLRDFVPPTRNKGNTDAKDSIPDK